MLESSAWALIKAFEQLIRGLGRPSVRPSARRPVGPSVPYYFQTKNLKSIGVSDRMGGQGR